jgi:hypothetical protein
VHPMPCENAQFSVLSKKGSLILFTENAKHYINQAKGDQAKVQRVYCLNILLVPCGALSDCHCQNQDATSSFWVKQFLVCTLHNET